VLRRPSIDVLQEVIKTEAGGPLPFSQISDLGGSVPAVGFSARLLVSGTAVAGHYAYIDATLLLSRLVALLSCTSRAFNSCSCWAGERVLGNGVSISETQGNELSLDVLAAEPQTSACLANRAQDCSAASFTETFSRQVAYAKTTTTYSPLGTRQPSAHR
jgi:hypothetical protein